MFREEDETNMQGCCNKLSICLAVLVMFLLLIIVFGACLCFFLGLAAMGFSEPPKECTNSACIKASALINEFIDDTVDPCENFYSFVCGKFEKVAYEKQMNNLLRAERKRIQRQLDTYIVDPAHTDDPKPVRMQKAYFRSCLNEVEMDQFGDQTLKRKLQEIGDWPLLHRQTSWVKKDFEWTEVMLRARQVGLPFEWFLKVDLFNNANYELKLSKPQNCGEKLTDEYFAMQRDILEMFTKPGIDTISEFSRLEQFERNLSNICTNTTINSISEGLMLMPYLRLGHVKTEHFLNALTDPPERWRLDNQVAFNPRYVSSLNKLLQFQKEEQANYILWKIIEYFAPYLSKPVRKRHAQYRSEISGQDSTRFEFCLEDTKSRFKYVSEIIHLQQYAESSIQEDGEKLITSIQEQVVEFIETVEWRNNKTKESHLNFYDNLENIIGGPKEMFEESYLDDHFSVGKLLYFSDNIIELIVDWSQTTFEAKMKMMWQPASMDLSYVYDANTDFVVILDEDEQQLILPATAFNSFLYDSDLPQYFNYAGLGAILGQELLRGLKLTAKGKHETYKGFEEKRKCLTESIKKVNKHVNAPVLFATNYEWLVAEELAYKAYQTYVENNEEEAQIINSPYSPNQLFWIKSSLTWCCHNLPEENSRYDMHDVYKYRILETVKHSQYFAADFNCTSEAHMNPKNKCQLV